MAVCNGDSEYFSNAKRIRNAAQIEFDTELQSSPTRSSDRVRHGAQIEFDTELKSSSRLLFVSIFAAAAAAAGPRVTKPVPPGPAAAAAAEKIV